MNTNKSVLQAVSEEFPDLKPDQAKKLVLSSLNWLTTVGAAASKRLVSLNEDELLLEHRAQSIAFGVLAKMMSLETAAETDKIDIITSILEAISTTGAAVPPLGN